MALTDNLIHYYKFETDSPDAWGGGTPAREEWTDEVGGDYLRNRGTVLSLQTGILGYCVGFTGSVNSATSSVSTYSLAAADFTINFWFYPTTLTGGETYVPVSQFTTLDNNSWRIIHDGTNKKVNVQYYDSGSWATAVEPTVMSINTWYMITAQYIKATPKFRVKVNNGSWYDSATCGTPLQSGTRNLEVGCENFAGAYYWCKGRVDALGVWTRAISDAEVTSLYNSGAGLEYPFSGGGGGAVKSLRPNKFW